MIIYSLKLTLNKIGTFYLNYVWLCMIMYLLEITTVVTGF